MEITLKYNFATKLITFDLNEIVEMSSCWENDLLCHTIVLESGKKLPFINNKIFSSIKKIWSKLEFPENK